MTATPTTRPRRWWLIALALLAVSIAGFGRFMNFSLRGQSTESAADRPQRRNVVCFGYVDLENGVTKLHPTQPGRVAEILVREGQEVPADAVLLRMVDDVPKARAEQARLGVESATADLLDARLKLPEKHKLDLQRQNNAITLAKHLETTKKIAYERARNLAQNASLASPSEVAIAKEVWEAGQLQVSEEEDKLKLLQLQDPNTELRRLETLVAERTALLNQAQADLAEYTLRAPKAGTVLRISCGPGDPLGPTSRQFAIEFCAEGPRIIRAEVEQAHAAPVAAGLAVKIEDGANAPGAWTGRVERVSNWFTRKRAVLQEPDQFNDVRTLECVIALDPGQPPLRINQRVLVIIQIP